MGKKRRSGILRQPDKFKIVQKKGRMPTHCVVDGKVSIARPESQQQSQEQPKVDLWLSDSQYR